VNHHLAVVHEVLADRAARLRPGTRPVFEPAEPDTGASAGSAGPAVALAAPFELAVFSGDAASLATVPGAGTLTARARRACGLPFVPAAFVGAAFVGAAFVEAAFVGAAFVGAAFVGAAFVGAAFAGAAFVSVARAFVAVVRDVVVVAGVPALGASECLATSARPFESTSE
jgi:hypothetical protein